MYNGNKEKYDCYYKKWKEEYESKYQLSDGYDIMLLWIK